MLYLTHGGVNVKKRVFLVLGIVVILFAVVSGVNRLLTDFFDRSNVVCEGQTFSSAEEAVQAMESGEREATDASLDYCPPYEVVYTFEYDQNTIVFYSYCSSSDGEQSESYAVRVLKHNDDGTMSFDSGFADFCLEQPDGTEDYYFFTNITTEKGSRSISFLYLPKDSEGDIYVDGIKAEKSLVSIQEREFYVCYAVSGPDTFLSNLFTAVADRHDVEVK